LACSLQLAESNAYESAYGFSVAEAKFEAISARSNAHCVCHDQNCTNTAILSACKNSVCVDDASDDALI
jgi:hypothetical protein